MWPFESAKLADQAFAAVDLTQYRRISKTLEFHQMQAVKRIPRDVMPAAARKFGLLKHGELLLGSEGELPILFDYIIYNYRIGRSTVVQDYLSSLPVAEDEDEAIVLAAMAGARYSIYEIERVVPGYGFFARDLIRGVSRKVVDLSLSQTVRTGAFFCSRLLPLPDYWKTSGGGFPMEGAIVEKIKVEVFPKYGIVPGKPTEPPPDTENKLATRIISTGFDTGQTQRIGFVKPSIR